jgi:HD-GYP domain-containing protein (c-di-GMP phosphodiesterase class II)
VTCEAGVHLNEQARMLADVFDAMLQDRPYRAGMPVKQALSILRRESGTNKLCPRSVGILEDLVSEGELP